MHTCRIASVSHRIRISSLERPEKEKIKLKSEPDVFEGKSEESVTFCFLCLPFLSGCSSSYATDGQQPGNTAWKSAARLYSTSKRHKHREKKLNQCLKGKKKNIEKPTISIQRASDRERHRTRKCPTKSEVVDGIPAALKGS